MANIENKEDFGFSSFHLFGYILKKFRFLMYVAIAAAVVSAAVSFLIPPMYKAKTIIFPAANTAVSEVLLTNYPSTAGLEGFGGEIEAERVLQILNSDIVIDKMNAKYGLYAHYKIKLTSKTKKSTLYKEFESNTSFHRTEYNSIQISVLDKDPVLASNMANDIADLVDTVLNNIRKDRVRQAMNIVSKEYIAYQEKVKVMEDSINHLRKNGVNSYEGVVDRLTEGYSKALINNNPKAAEKIDARLQTMVPFATEYISLRERIGGDYGQLANLKNRLLAMKIEVEQMLPTIYIVDRAYPPDKKSSPIRSLIIILSVLSSLIIALIAALIFDNWNYLKSQMS